MKEICEDMLDTKGANNQNNTKLKLPDSKIGQQDIQDKSEIKLFNEIGEIVIWLGFTPKFFKVLNPTFEETETGIEIGYKYIHYIHILKKEQLKISIYYDKYNIGSILPDGPYFELYDMDDIERFIDNEIEIKRLLERLSILLKQYK